jgi:hypothetical protein
MAPLKVHNVKMTRDVERVLTLCEVDRHSKPGPEPEQRDIGQEVDL